MVCLVSVPKVCLVSDSAYGLFGLRQYLCSVWSQTVPMVRLVLDSTYGLFLWAQTVPMVYFFGLEAVFMVCSFGLSKRWRSVVVVSDRKQPCWRYRAAVRAPRG